ncbi:MAG: flagellar hook-basal body complex protein [Arcobacteraceae bacterium]|nr:flagellar hook-basal body complex protein [Arcobacteraceae bacterium]
MIGALWTGISGLSSHQKALDNEATNIANVNTVGYKASRISFADQMYQDKIGKGSKVLDAEKLYVQGNLKVTGVSFDMALSGSGFFAVANTRSSGASETFYTRAGNFRMGEDGSLQDAAGNKVQGWAMRDVDADVDVKSTNPNVTSFTNDYIKLGASKIIRHNNKVETITAKMTDYNQVAVADSTTVFSGAGLKTKSAKIIDVETLISDYNLKLTAYQSNPAATSSPSQAQVSYVKFPMDTASAEGDQMYVYLNGTKYSQSFEYDAAKTDDENRMATLKKLADFISTIPGFVAYTAAGTPPNLTETTDELAANGGFLKIESLIPGKLFTLGEVAESSGVTTSVGSVVTSQGVDAIAGTGFGAVKSAQEALLKAVSGMQKDVYTLSDLGADLDSDGTLDTATNFTYQLSIYSPELKTNIDVPTIPLTITGATTVDDIVAAINGNVGAGAYLANYVEAKNVNGALVIQAKDELAGYKINGTLAQTNSVSEIQTVEVSGTATGPVTFLGEPVTGSLAADSAAATVTLILADAADIMATWNAANPTKEITSIVAGGTATELVITYANDMGNVANIDSATSAGITFGESVETTSGSIPATREKNSSYSGFTGAGAEFIQMINTIDQTASQGGLQLRLDVLNISDSAFGEFNVDSSGLITMMQDGAEYAIGQVAVALFNNERGLIPIGDNLVRKSNESGEPIFNVNNDKTAKIEARTLELSTADLSESLVNLMVFQRAFEANAKSITTSDELLNTLINLKR